MNRREVFKVGLASAAALSTGKLALAATARPTDISGDLGAYADFLRRHGMGRPARRAAAPAAPSSLAVTEDNIAGPYFRDGAPTRFSLVQPNEPGVPLVIRGRVWAFDTKRPLAGATIHVWQADDHGRYDNDDPQNPPTANEFVNRAVIFSDAQGGYEYLSIHPGRYLNGDTYRPAHIHYFVYAPGYEPLVTQLYFDGDPYNATDPFIKPSLIIKLSTQQRYKKSFENGVFDIVLKPL